MSAPLFVYGTLGFPEVLSGLLGRTVAMQTGVIEGFRRITVKNKVYPGLVRSPGKSVAGTVLTDLTSAEMELLDTFEDDFYERMEVPILLANGLSVSASVYVIPKRNSAFATTDAWDREVFRRNYLKRYRSMTRQYRKDYLAGKTDPQNFIVI